MPKTIAFKGKPLTLAGRRIQSGDYAPDFRVVGSDLEEITLAHFQDKIKLITSFPSLDTAVCDLQVKEFNKKAASFSEEIALAGISKDLPFAQKRFCRDNDIKSIALFSDYKYSSFGINYGLLIKEMNLLARSILILDKNNIIRYIQVVPELSAAPDYGEALGALSEVVNSPAAAAKEGLPAKCRPCEGGALALPKERAEQLILQSRGWQLVEGKKIIKEFKFKDFAEAKYFLDLVCVAAEEQGHHPAMTLTYNKVKLALTTHAAGGLTENDFILAGIIDSF